MCGSVCVRLPGPGQMRGGGAHTNARPPVGAPTSSRRSLSYLITGPNKQQITIRVLSIPNPLFLSMPPLTLMSVCALFRSPNCVSSYSAANAAAAIGGTKSARPLSMAATPLSNRRWLIETACRLEEDCVGYPIWVFEDVPLSRCPYLAPVCVWCRRMYTFSGHSCHSTVCDRDGSRATHTFPVESVAIQLSCILDVLEENEWLAQI